MNLLLNIPFGVSDYSLDESVSTKYLFIFVKLKKFRKKEVLKTKNLNCIIKHGKYTLMQMIPIITTQLMLPFKITASSTVTNNVK